MANSVPPKSGKNDNEAQKRGKNGEKAAAVTYRGTTQGKGSTGKYD